MSLCPRPGSICRTCGHAKRSVYGSAQWHARNDPPSGYCSCESDQIRAMRESVKALTADDLAVLSAELAREDLQYLTAVKLARRNLEADNVVAAVLCLRVDADKLRCLDTPLNDLLSRICM